MPRGDGDQKLQQIFIYLRAIFVFFTFLYSLVLLSQAFLNKSLKNLHAGTRVI